MFHHRQQLREYAFSDKRTQEEKIHMKLLTDFMDKNLANTEKDHDRLISTKSISSDMIWTLFPPGEILVEQNDRYLECFVVVAVYNSGVLIEVRRWDYNGARFRPSEKYTKIEDFTGVRKISALETYPIKFYEQSGEQSIEERLIARGRRWRHLVDVCHRAYSGISDSHFQSSLTNNSMSCWST